MLNVHSNTFGSNSWTNGAWWKSKGLNWGVRIERIERKSQQHKCDLFSYHKLQSQHKAKHWVNSSQR